MSFMGSIDHFNVVARVDAGAAWLDLVHPDWRSEIDSETLDISADCHCMLGQLFGSYKLAIDQLNLGDRVKQFGFVAIHYTDGGDAEYAALTAEWQRRLAA